MGSPHGQGFGEPIGGSDETAVGKSPTRGLLADVLAPEAAKTTWIYSIVTNPVYGGFSVNVLADFFVRILLFIGTFVTARLCYGRARKRERIARDLEFQRKLDQALEIRKILESMVVGSQGSPGSSGMPPAAHADNSTAQSSSAAPPPVPENHAQITGSIPAGSVPGSIPQASSSTSAILTMGFTPAPSIPGSPTNSTNAVPTEPTIAVQTSKLRYRNGYTIRSKSMGHAPSTSSKSPPVAIPCQEDVAKEHHVIDIPFSCRFPSLTTESKKGNKFKEKVKDKMGVAFDHDVFSSRMMQARVPATEGNLSALREVAIEGMELDDGFTLQIGASFMYCCTGNYREPVLLSLRDVEVPTVLQAEYSAGMLILQGKYLEGAEIRVVTAEGYMILASVKQDPIDSKSLTPEERIETWRCTDLLPPVKLDQIQIFASKRVQIEGQSVAVRSELCPIQDTTLRTSKHIAVLYSAKTFYRTLGSDSLNSTQKKFSLIFYSLTQFRILGSSFY